ncbi:MAG: AMP-binding protein [Aurantibacter sp.]
MIPSYKTLHKDFKFNGLSYSREALTDLGYSFVKEGEGHERSIGEFLLAWHDKNEAVEVETSGSTGTPKSVLLKKEHMKNSALATGEYFNLIPGSSSLLCLSADYIAGKMMLVRAMVLGLELDYVEPSSNPLTSGSRQYDFCAMVPLQLENSLRNIDQIKTLIVGGAPITNAIREKTRHVSCQIFETYGMTETVTHVAVKEINYGHTVRSNVVANSFKAMPEVAFSKDERNCLVIDAPNIAGGLVITNDVVNIISETEFTWLGRYDNVINSGGIKLFPERIELKLAPIISNRFFVAGLPDEKLGQKLVLIVEGEVDVTELATGIKEHDDLEKFERPKSIFCVPSFLETKNGKLNRQEILNQFL